MKKILLSSILVCCSLLALGQQLGFKLLDGAKRVKIPFEVYNNLIVVPVILNNQIPLKFIIDTGVRTAILTEKAYSDILGLTYNKKYTISGLGENELVEAYVTNNVSLTLPGVRGKGHALLVLNEDYLELRNYLGTDVHGILGYELFSRFIVKIDYDQKILTLTTPKNFNPKRSYDAVPMSIEDTKPYINGIISYDGKKGVPVKLLIDTGASHGLLLEKESKNDIVVPNKNINSELGRGLGGRINGKIGRLYAFHIGEHCWKDVIATFPTKNTFLDSLKYGQAYRNGSIGGEVLSRLKIIIDYSSETVYIKRGKEYKHEFDYNMSGVSVKAMGSRLNAFEITDIRIGSPADVAGLKTGDHILSINHYSTASMKLGNVNNALNNNRKKKLNLLISRGDEKLKVVIRVKSQI